MDDPIVVYCENCGRRFELVDAWPGVCTCGHTRFSNVRADTGLFERPAGVTPAAEQLPIGTLGRSRGAYRD